MAVGFRERDWSEIVRRHRAFWACEELDRPLIGVVHNLYIDPQLVALALGEGERQPQDVDPAPILDEYDKVALTREQIGDDLIGTAEPLMGIPWLEAICGCQVVASDTSVWPQSPPEGTRIDGIEFSEDNPWFQKLLETMHLIVEFVGDRYMVTNTSHLRGTSDVLAALLGSNQFYLSLYDDPDRIAHLAEQVADVWINIVHAQTKIAASYRGGYGLRQFMLWAPAPTVWLQDDMSGMISLQHYRRFFLKPVCRMSSLPYGVFHLHIPSLHVAETVADVPNVRAVNVYFDSPSVTLQDAMPTLARLQARRMPLILGKDSYEGFSLEEYDEILEVLSPRGLCVHLKADSVEEGREVMAHVREKAASGYNRQTVS